VGVGGAASTTVMKKTEATIAARAAATTTMIVVLLVALMGSGVSIGSSMSPAAGGRESRGGPARSPPLNGVLLFRGLVGREVQGQRSALAVVLSDTGVVHLQ